MENDLILVDSRKRKSMVRNVISLALVVAGIVLFNSFGLANRGVSILSAVILAMGIGGLLPNVKNQLLKYALYLFLLILLTGFFLVVPKYW